MAANLELFPDAAAPAGIAGLAASAPPLQARNVAQFAALAARSLLSRCQSARLPFEWTLNPYRGCEFGCQYCYARYTHAFMELRGVDDFERRIFVKQEAARLLRRDLGRVRPGERIAIGTATDPYQPAERRFAVTQQVLEVFAACRGMRLSLITKSDLIRRDVALLQRVAAANELHVRITITTTDIALARALEPRAPRPDLRLAAVAELSRAGLWVGVMCAPVLPAITDSRAGLEAVARAAAAAGARSFHAQPLFLQPCAQAKYFPFLEQCYPHLAGRYRRAYARSAYLPGSYTAALARRVAAIRAACFPAS